MVDHNNKEFCRDCVEQGNKMVILVIDKKFGSLRCPWCGNNCADEDDRMSWNEVHLLHLEIDQRQKELAKQLVREM